MSTCISRHGEFSSHVTNEELWCDRCAAWDETAIERMVKERPLLLAVVEAYEGWTGDPDGWAEVAAAVRAYRATTGEAGNG